MPRSSFIGVIAAVAFAASCPALGAETVAEADMAGAVTAGEEQQVIAAEDAWVRAEIERDEATLRDRKSVV